MTTSRHSRLLALTVAVTTLLASCAAGEGESSRAPSVPRAEVQDLRVAVGEDEFLRGTPPTPNLGLLVDGLNPGIFETLTRLTSDFGLTAGLAARWEAESPTLWRFQLRSGVTFHDGSPLTAAAVVDTLHRVSGGFVNSELENVALRQSRPRGLEPDSATAVGEDVVEVALSEPNLRLAEQLANPRMAVQAPGTRAGGGTTPSETPTGTGPFRFRSYQPGAELQVEAYAGYWGGPPALDSITFRFGPEEDASRLLATRQVDVVGLVPPQMLAKVSGRTDRRVTSPPARSAFVLLNRGGVGQWSTLQESSVRRAVAMALDRDVVAEAGWPDHGEVNESLVPPVVLDASADEVNPPSHDLEAANALLDEAGWVPGPDGIRERDGQRLELDLLVRRPVGLEDAAAAIRSQLGAAGIGARGAQPLEAGSPLQRVNAATFDLFLDVRPQDDANPCSLCRFFSIRPGGQLTVAGVVRAGPEADALFDQVHVAPSVDTARRLTAEMMQVVTAEEVVAVPLATLRHDWLLSSRVQGFEPAGIAGAQSWHGVYLSP